jgi:hypothetical protein
VEGDGRSVPLTIEKGTLLPLLLHLERVHFTGPPLLESVCPPDEAHTITHTYQAKKAHFTAKP